ncbi:MAG: hypothetical protein IJK63_10790 [Oscillospiraceae bacterium]|nr:hypothetical protein [Oscillospiraceae bacterium]
MKRGIAILLALVMTVALLAGCGGSSDPTGRYVVKTIAGQPVEEYFKSMLGEDADFALQMFGVSSYEELMTVELKSDGSAVATLAGEAAETGTWKQDGDQITITIQDDPATFTLKGNELSYKEDGQDYVLVKK